MQAKQNVKWILEAIEDLRERIKLTIKDNNTILAKELMGDLYALERCLVGETTKLIYELDKKVA